MFTVEILLNKALIAVVVVTLLVVIYLLVLGQISRGGKPPGLADGKLQPCPATPNCVCSEYPGDGSHRVEPFELGNEPGADALRRLARIIERQGGAIDRLEESYLAASFRSPVFGFIDDFEARADAANGVLQVRSASRVGRSDFGANRERVEAVRQLWQPR